MWLLEWIAGSGPPPPAPRSYDEIKAEIEQRGDAVHLRRMNRVEESLLTLTAEVGLDDLRRRMETIRAQESARGC